MARFRFTMEVSEPVRRLGGDDTNMIVTGDVIELTGWLAEKARMIPHYQEIKRGRKPKAIGNGSADESGS